MSCNSLFKPGFLFRWLAAATLFCVISGTSPGRALAEDNYPSKPIRLVVGFSAGGVVDILARVLAAKLSGILGQQVYVENRVGAGGSVATEAVARAKPDGYTILAAGIANAINETLLKNFRYKLGEHLMAVAMLGDSSLVLVTHPALEVKTVADLIALAKSRPPGEILLATAGRGSSSHLTNELFNIMAGVKIASIHYRGGPDAIKDLLSGDIKAAFVGSITARDLIRTGRLRGIATSGAKRDSILLDLPTVSEAGLPGFQVSLWTGLLAPAGTPANVVNRLSAAVAQAMESPELKAAFAAQGIEPLSSTSEQFNEFYRREVTRWRTVIETAGIGNE